MKRRSFLRAGAAGVAAASLPRFSIAQPANARVLKFVPQANLTVLDPIITTAAVTINHGWMVWDTLFGVNAAQQAKPQMAEGYTVSDDGRTYLIKLRDGLKFHDGEPVRAQDCAASLARWAVRDTFGQTAAKSVDTWGSADDKTIKITLKRPFPLLIDAIAVRHFVHHAGAAGEDRSVQGGHRRSSAPVRSASSRTNSSPAAPARRGRSSTATCRGRRRRNGPPAARSRTSSVSSGRSFRMHPPRPPRCRPARSIGMSRLSKTWCRCCAQPRHRNRAVQSAGLHRRHAVQLHQPAIR